MRYSTSLGNIAFARANPNSNGVFGYTPAPDKNDMLKYRNAIFGGMNYPTYSEAMKSYLEETVLLHYWDRGIGFETAGMFLLKTESRLREIMPKYNLMYKALEEVNNLTVDEILFNMDITTSTNKDGQTHTEGEYTNNSTTERDESFTNASSTTRNSTSKNKYSDTPQGSISNLENDRYLSSASIDNNTGTTNGSNNGFSGVDSTTNGGGTNEKQENTSSTELQEKKGYYGNKTKLELLREYEKINANIIEQIINDLDVLFLQIWEF